MTRGHSNAVPTRPPSARRARLSRGLPAVALVAALAALAGCASSGPTDNPLARKLTWFSYLSGDDLRAACGPKGNPGGDPGGADRFRMIFNADYNRHVRTYDVVGDRTQGGAAVEAHVIEATDLARLTPLDPFSAARGRTATTRLSAGQFQSLIGRLNEDGAFDTLPTGLRLPSNGFYWLISGCRAGQWFFTAYPYPSGRFADAGFPEALRRIDPTGVAFPTLPPPDEAPRALPGTGERDEGGVYFQVELDHDGLAGPTAPFGALFGG